MYLARNVQNIISKANAVENVVEKSVTVLGLSFKESWPSLPITIYSLNILKKSGCSV